MIGVRNINYLSYTTLFLAFLVLFLFHSAFPIYANTLSSTESLTISSNRTIVSPGDDFELGFFKPGSSSRWYLGIWYKKVPQRTYVWVANRDNPLSNSIGTLKILKTNLVLLDHSNNPIWSTNLTRGNVQSPVVAELLANGNFVMRYSNNYNNSGFLWQSFDFPTDTLLPEIKLGVDLKTGHNRFLTSWKSEDDPSSGDYSLKLETRGFPEILLWKREAIVYRGGPWNGIRFSGVPEVRQQNYMVFNFTQNGEEVAYTFRLTNRSIYSRLTVSSSGSLERFTWIPTLWAWSRSWTLPTDTCDIYLNCGAYAYCDVNTSPVCNCIRGFDPKYPHDWALRDGSSGCVRRTQLSCIGDGFLKLQKMKLPGTKMAIVDRRISLEKCKEMCLRDCNCTSFANADVRNGGSGCVIWTGELADLQNYTGGGQDLYVRLAATDLG